MSTFAEGIENYEKLHNECIDCVETFIRLNYGSAASQNSNFEMLSHTTSPVDRLKHEQCYEQLERLSELRLEIKRCIDHLCLLDSETCDVDFIGSKHMLQSLRKQTTLEDILCFRLRQEQPYSNDRDLAITTLVILKFEPYKYNSK